MVLLNQYSSFCDYNCHIDFQTPRLLIFMELMVLVIAKRQNYSERDWTWDFDFLKALEIFSFRASTSSLESVGFWFLTILHSNVIGRTLRLEYCSYVRFATSDFLSPSNLNRTNNEGELISNRSDYDKIKTLRNYEFMNFNF